MPTTVDDGKRCEMASRRGKCRLCRRQQKEKPARRRMPLGTGRHGSRRPREMGRPDKKGVVGRVGLEPTTKGLCVPLRLSPPVSGSWSGLCLAFRPSRRVSTRSPAIRSFARHWHGTEDGTRAFTEFEKFYLAAACTTPGNPCGVSHERNRKTHGMPCAPGRRTKGNARQVLCSDQLS